MALVFVTARSRRLPRMFKGKFDWFDLKLGLVGSKGLDLSLKGSVRVSAGPCGPTR